jgi:hypothetical protein
LNQNSCIKTTRSINRYKVDHKWNTGDLLVVVKTHTIARATYDKNLFDCILRTSENGLFKEDTIEEGTTVIALDPCPEGGKLAMVRVLYKDKIWVLNSNYVVSEQNVIWDDQ